MEKKKEQKLLTEYRIHDIIYELTKTAKKNKALTKYLLDDIIEKVACEKEIKTSGLDFEN